MAPQTARKNVRSTSLTLVDDEDPPRYSDGWRAGKPVEDPEKMKRWGFVTAKPSEYLVCVQRGRINRRASGQGARVFKWPWESIAIVPTSLQRVEFVADQITRERVGVQVTGIAVYRIVEPEIAFRVLNFSYGERASEKLRETLREMFIGAARRLVANLCLDECLMKRKEAIAAFLMQEIAPVVSGRGAPEDSTDRGWGVVIDTIEIQDVQIKSDKVFADLQATYRAELATRAATAELDRGRQVAEREASTQLEISRARIESQRQTRLLKAHADAEAALAEATENLRAEQARAEAAAAELARREALERRRLEVDEALALREAERVANVERQAAQLKRERELAQIREAEERRRLSAEAEAKALEVEVALAEQSHQAELRRLQQLQLRQQTALDAELGQRESQARVDLELRRREAATSRIEQAIAAEHARALAEVEALTGEARALQDLVNTGLPAIAEAFRQNLGTVHYTHLGSGDDAGPLAMVSGAIAQVLAVARSFGLDPERLRHTVRQPAASGPSAPPTVVGTPVVDDGGKTDDHA